MYKAFIQLKYCWKLYIYNITVCLYLDILFPEEENELYIKIKSLKVEFQYVLCR